jgi:uncharacterized protein (TIGR03086 family)
MQPSPDDLLALLDRALDQAGERIAATTPDQAARPTPCRSFDLRALVNHTVHDVKQFTGMAAGGRYDRDERDLLGDGDWGEAFAAAAAGLRAAWRRPGALERTVHLPSGDLPATWSLGQQIADLAVHAWDIATASGQPTELDPEVGAYALAWGADNLKPPFRGTEAEGKSFGPEVAVDPGAPVYDRLAGVFGRDPGVR